MYPDKLIIANNTITENTSTLGGGGIYSCGGLVLNNIITFNNLDESIILKIVEKQLNEFKTQLKQKKIKLRINKTAKKWLAKNGYSRLFGAREVARLIQDKVKKHFVDEVLFGKLAKGGTAKVSVKNDELAVEFEEKQK